jgi:hypothetical protein
MLHPFIEAPVGFLTYLVSAIYIIFIKIIGSQ